MDINYDPNHIHLGAPQTVRLTLQQWELVATIDQTVIFEGKALYGMAAIDTAISQAFDEVASRSTGLPTVEFKNADGQSRRIKDYGDKKVEWLKRMVVKAEIIDVDVEPLRDPSQWCDTMERPVFQCGCPDCGSSLIG